MLKAIGIDKSGKRGSWVCRCALSEAEVHWREFLASLVSRGLSGVRLIPAMRMRDLAAARRAVLGRCAVAALPVSSAAERAAYVPRQELKAEVAADIRAIFNAPDKPSAVALLERAIAEVPEASEQAGELAGAEHPRRADGLRVARGTAAFAAHDQWLRTGEQGDQTAHQRGGDLPQ